MTWTSMKDRKPNQKGFYAVCTMGARVHTVYLWPGSGIVKELWGYVTHWILLPPDPDSASK